MTAPRRMLLNAFHMNCVSHIQQGLWVRDDTRQREYTQLEPWVELAQILEKGCFDGHCSADSEIDIDRAGDRFSPTGPNLLLLRRVHHVRTG